MRVVGVSRVLNEADIIEPFIRHHAGLLDLHIVLDNGSSDETVPILRALHAEGLNLQVYQSAAPIFLETEHNTGLYRLALQEGADWVVFLDADELLIVHQAERPADILALAPDGIPALRLAAFNYARPAPEPHPFMNLTHRGALPDMNKVAVRRMDPARVAVYAGNHFAFIDGREEPGLVQDRLWLAHVPDRSPLQRARKAILARLKSMASGAAAAAHFGTHRRSDYEALIADPAAWLEREAAAQSGVPDRAAYRGGPLRYTTPADDLARLISQLAAEAGRLARSHGAILDAKRLIKAEMVRKGNQATRLL